MQVRGCGRRHGRNSTVVSSQKGRATRQSVSKSTPPEFLRGAVRCPEVAFGYFEVPNLCRVPRRLGGYPSDLLD
jgi:acetyl-CoA carboxylase alpha subunit